MSDRVRRWALWLCLVLPAGMATPALADDGGLGLSVQRDDELELVYFDALGYLAPHARRTFAQSLAWQRRVLGWQPSQPVSVLLRDFKDHGGGSARVAPTNVLTLDVAPLSLAFETFPASERLSTLMNHELVHVATGDLAAADDRFWRRVLFGKVDAQRENPESLLYAWLTVPRFTVPRWFMEGSAVFFETWMSGGLGRAQGGYDEMVFRAMVRDGAHFYDPLGLASRGVRVDFQAGANAYLYGTRFMTWLAFAWSPEHVVAWLRRDDGSERHYAAQFRAVFGVPLETAWQRWIAFEREFQQRNLALVRQRPVTQHVTLRGSALGSISRTFYDEASGILYGAFRTPGVFEHVGALDTRDGSYRELAPIQRATLYNVASFAFDRAGGIAFFTNDEQGYRDLMAVDVKSGEVRELIGNARVGEIAFNPTDRSLLGVRHANGLAMLVRIPPPYRSVEPLYAFPYGSVPTDLDISSDGRLLSATVTEANADQYLRVWPLERALAGDLTPRAEFAFGTSVPESFVFSPDGRALYGSSYYSGASNIFRFDIASGAMDAVTNAETGYFRPTPLADGRLAVLHYTAEGFVPALIDPQPVKDVSAIRFLGAELAERHPVVKTWQVTPAAQPSQPPPESSPYRPVGGLGLRSAYPVLQGYKSSAGLGYRWNLEDPLRLASLSLTAAVTPGAGELPGEQRGLFEASARLLTWRAGLAWNRSDFYDLFGPTKRSRKGFAATLGKDNWLIFDEPRKLVLKTDLAFYDRIDTLPEAQNVGTAGFTRLATGTIAAQYSDLSRTLGAIDDEKGRAWNVELELHRTGPGAEARSGARAGAGVDLGVSLPLPHASLWSRTAVGAAGGRRDDPLAAFYFGGFGNNVVDNRTVARFRDLGSMPGFEIDEIGARRFARQMIEVNLPPTIFESVGWPDLHLNWLRPTLFAAALRAWPRERATPSRSYASLGTQFDLRFSVLHWYEMVLSAGVAQSYRGSRRGRHEWMVSLKVM